MSGSVLFLFPARMYVREAEAWLRDFYREERGLPEREARSRTATATVSLARKVDDYRDRNWRVYWAVFSNGAGGIDERGLSGRLGMERGDLFLSCGLTEREMRRTTLSPNYPSIFDSLHERPVVIGGFHYADCVQEAASAARRLGVGHRVDEELTDCQYHSIPLGGKPRAVTMVLELFNRDMAEPDIAVRAQFPTSCVNAALRSAFNAT